MEQEFYTGQALYESTAKFKAELALVHPFGVFDIAFLKTWDELPWDARDYWEAQADELNEARRDPHDS